MSIAWLGLFGVLRSRTWNLPRFYRGAVHENEEIDVLADNEGIGRILTSERNLVQPVSVVSGCDDANRINMPIRRRGNDAVELLSSDRLGATGRERRDFLCRWRPLGGLANVLERNCGSKVLIADITVGGICTGPLLPVRKQSYGEKRNDKESAHET